MALLEFKTCPLKYFEAKNFNFLLFYIVSACILESFEGYLQYRQLRNIKRQSKLSSAEKSKLAKGNVLIEKKIADPSYQANLEYSKDKIVFHIVHSIISTLIALFSIIKRLEPKLWSYAQTVSEVEYYSVYFTLMQSALFVSILVLVNTVLELPFGLYADFVLEEKHGFNKKTLWLFFKDLFLSLIIQAAFGLPVMFILIYFENIAGDKFYLYAFIFGVIFSLVMSTIYPIFIAPLFNKYTPLENERLSKKIYALANEKKLPLNKIFQVDESKRSGHSNAFFYGFWWFKRLVICDTMLVHSDEQILAVVAHEIGHWWHNHVAYGLGFSWFQMFLIFYFYTTYRHNDYIFQSFGFKGLRGFVISITLLLRIYSPFSVLVSLFVNKVSRTFEYQADTYAVSCGYGNELKAGLVELLSENKVAFFPDPLYSTYYYSHPTITERFDNIDEKLSLGKDGKVKSN